MSIEGFEECDTLPDPWDQFFCKEIRKNEDNIDQIKLQIYVLAGVLGGAALILIIFVILLAAQLYQLRQSIAGGKSDDKPKPTPDRGMTTKNQNGHPNAEGGYSRHPAPHTYAQPPQNLTSEQELAQLGFSAYTGHSRGMPTSPSVTGSTGGVRVLPRNPPSTSSGFRNGAYNDGF